MVAGGVFVVLFALVAEVLKPKTFSGLFGAAPSVALASLLVAALTRGPASVQADAFGMLIGVAGMIAYCVAATVLVQRLGALAGSLLAWGAWFVAAVGLYAVVA
jgi:uncharacterized membrane protein (GlpM family)